MIKNEFLLLLIVLILLSSCAQGQAISPIISPQVTIKPSMTPSPSHTPTIAPTPLFGSSSLKILHTRENSDVTSIMVQDIYITSLDTQISEFLTNNSNENIKYSAPVVSHDGEKIAYVKGFGETILGNSIFTSFIYIMDNYGEKLISQPIINQKDGFILSEGYPSWSPDDKKLAFNSNRGAISRGGNSNEAEIFVIDLESLEIQQLTEASGYSMHPSWSSDGEYISFMSDRDLDWDIYYMKSDGSEKEVKITDNNDDDRFPSWSNNGDKIVYHSDRGGSTNLYIYDIVTGEEIQLTNSPYIDATASWSPDDLWITFCSDRDGDFEIFIMNLETKEEFQITSNQLYDGFPTWIP